jgi:hypothetical protein
MNHPKKIYVALPTSKQVYLDDFFQETLLSTKNIKSSNWKTIKPDSNMMEEAKYVSNEIDFSAPLLACTLLMWHRSMLKISEIISPDPYWLHACRSTTPESHSLTSTRAMEILSTIGVADKDQMKLLKKNVPNLSSEMEDWVIANWKEDEIVANNNNMENVINYPKIGPEFRQQIKECSIPAFASVRSLCAFKNAVYLYGPALMTLPCFNDDPALWFIPEKGQECEQIINQKKRTILIMGYNVERDLFVAYQTKKNPKDAFEIAFPASLYGSHCEIQFILIQRVIHESKQLAQWFSQLTTHQNIFEWECPPQNTSCNNNNNQQYQEEDEQQQQQQQVPFDRRQSSSRMFRSSEPVYGDQRQESSSAFPDGHMNNNNNNNTTNKFANALGEVQETLAKRMYNFVSPSKYKDDPDISIPITEKFKSILSNALEEDDVVEFDDDNNTKIHNSSSRLFGHGNVDERQPPPTSLHTKLLFKMMHSILPSQTGEYQPEDNLGNKIATTDPDFQLYKKLYQRFGHITPHYTDTCYNSARMIVHASQNGIHPKEIRKHILSKFLDDHGKSLVEYIKKLIVELESEPKPNTTESARLIIEPKNTNNGGINQQDEKEEPEISQEQIKRLLKEIDMNNNNSNNNQSSSLPGIQEEATNENNSNQYQGYNMYN